MKYFLIGRYGSGKRYLANKLKTLGFKVTESYTTRPKRTDDETGHIFVTHNEANKIENKIALTEHDGHRYFLTTDQIRNSDIIIVDPEGALQIAKTMPDTAFHIIYIKAGIDDRLKHITNPSVEKTNKFHQRNIKENEMFTNFEREYLTPTGFTDYTNITAYAFTENDYSDTNFDDRIKDIKNATMLHKMLYEIVSVCIDNGILNKGEKPNTVKVWLSLPDNTTTIADEPIDCFADRLINDDEGLSIIMKNWLIYIADICPSIMDAIYSYPETDISQT